MNLIFAQLPEGISILHREACDTFFKRRASHVANALETIDNAAFQMIIYCFNPFGT
jgi:hypothetical protein